MAEATEAKTSIGDLLAGGAFCLIGAGLIAGGVGASFLEGVRHFSLPLIVAGLVCGFIGALGVKAALKRRRL
jgi:F0F1-type ATP synthase membrane subunit c/vacuolar-type H+-ATPase subunit K